MKIDHFHPDMLIAADARAARLRYWVAPMTAMIDCITVMLIVISASLSYHLAAYGHMGDARTTLELASFIIAIFVFTNAMRGRYRLTNYLSRKGQVMDAFTVWNVTMMAFIAVGFLAKVVDNYSRAVVLLTYLVGIPVIALARSYVTKVISSASKLGRITTERVLIVGREAEVMSFVSRHQPWNMGFAIVDAAFLREAAPEADKAGDMLRLSEDLAHAQTRIRELEPDAVYIAIPWAERETIERCIDAFMNTPVSIHLTPERIMDRFENPRISRIGSMASLELTRRPLSATEVTLKRVVDFIAAGLILIAAMPVFLLVALAIKLEGKGPIFFMQRRYGFNQHEFRIYKFRTMSTSDDGETIVQARKGDVRVTRVGAILRRWNLDELPQLFNVLAGHMSLVGPRPHALAHDREYERKIGQYARRHNVKPGITGWAQVNGYRGLTDTDDKMVRRVDHDLWYIDNWSLWLDFMILVRTIFSPKSFQNAF
jgi:Undecaprenyl-phosphate glucose phosphotransferase